MSNFFESLLDSGAGRNLMKSVLPKSVPLNRYNSSLEGFFEGRVLIGASTNATLIEQILQNFKGSKANVFYPAASATASLVIDAAKKADVDRKSTRLNSSHVRISYAVFCLKKKKKKTIN